MNLMIIILIKISVKLANKDYTPTDNDYEEIFKKLHAYWRITYNII